MAAGGEAITRDALERELALARAERDEAQAREAALAEVLQAVNASPGDPAPVFDMIIGKAMALCDAAFGALLTYEGEHLTLVAHRNSPPALAAYWETPQYVDPATTISQALREGTASQIVDLAQSENYRKRLPMTVASVELGGIRTLVQVPLRSERGPIGLFILYRREVRPFADRQLALVEAFAAQAAIAMENARLLNEQREALEQQTATADILRVISQSPTSVQPVFDVIAESALRLLGGWSVIVWRYDGSRLHIGAAKGGHPGSSAALPAMLEGLSPDDIFVGDAVRRGEVQRIIDVETEPVAPQLRELARARGWRSNLAVPMMREGQPVGVFTLARAEPGAFSERDVQLLQSFAAQAVIAIENVRLFTELREALDQQTATAEVLETINGSPGVLRPVFDVIVDKAM
ncbi:MAG: GAF domain-containing protein, partial [Proteobacteria bacterium]|nr:GAF domain-containing protein [Pseudomonadota bacterium]